MSIRGRAAERAISLACVTYRKQGRADITKQATGMRKYGSSWKFTTRSPIDYRGTVAGGRAWVGEIKQHKGASFPVSESTLSGKQREAMDVAIDMGADGWLVVDLYDVPECYAVEWKHVREFLCRPTRSSLSLSWLRAYGFVVRESGRGTDDFRLWFLERERHPLHLAAVEAERVQETKPVVELDRVIEKPQTRVQLTKEQRLAGVRDAVVNGKYRKKAKGWI